ncbi:O-methyltransferase, partial [Xylella fastidiosa subsp. multiplex]|nr:O-methyltransferase [Xylella fastidiosa subsp. multiplex]
MTQPAAVDELFDELLHTEDDALIAARLSTEPAGMPAIEVSAQHGHLLTLYAKLTNARRVLE